GATGPQGPAGAGAGPRTRSVSIALTDFTDCNTVAGGLTDFASGAEPRPDFARNTSQVASGFNLAFDDDAGHADEFFSLCTQLAVPEDWASGGALQIRAAQNLGPTAPSEYLRCRFAFNGGNANTPVDVLISAQPATSYTCAPTTSALTTNAALTVSLSVVTPGGTSPPVMNDPVFVYSVDFVYQAAG
ncbi:MAG: hypothetical protein M3320_05560, partial [Actinomycetota bacterium]|nr:hypothetical protein [Actinomycetota bacterium]